MRQTITSRLLVGGVVLVLAAFDGHAQRAAPPEYSYGSIPFGQTARRILSELSGATVETDEGAEAFFIGQYEVLPDFFTEGLYRNWLGQLQLSVEVTRRYRVSHASWENVQSIDLFFFRDHTAPADIGSYRLFMVRKTLDTGGDGSHTEVSEILEQAITRSLGIDPVSYDVKNVQFTHALGMPARISAWATADSDIFLLVFQNVFSVSDADILYRDRATWREYVAAARGQYEAQESATEDRTRSAGDSF